MSLDITGFDDAIKMLDKYSRKHDVDELARKAVNAAKGNLESSMKSAVSASEGHRGSPGKRHRKDRSTGSVAASVKATDAKVNSYGVYSVARPTGTDANGKRNGEKAAYLQYGTPTLKARPWRQKAVSGAEAECVRIVEEIIASELGAE